MTTIAYRNGIMAGDGRETSCAPGDDHESFMILDNSCVKVYRLKDGRLFGAASSSEDIYRLLLALQNNTPLPKLDDVQGLLIDVRGKIWTYEGTLWQPINKPYYAIGCGAVFAMPAMDAGASAIEAVKIGCGRDPFSGGKITSVRLRKRS